MQLRAFLLPRPPKDSADGVRKNFCPYIFGDTVSFGLVRLRPQRQRQTATEAGTAIVDRVYDSDPIRERLKK